MPNFRLQKMPQAFLGAFELKTDGRAPGEFADVVVGMTDLADHYLAGEQALGVVDGNLTNVGDTITIDVPAGICWRVHGVSGLASLVTETVLSAAIFYQPTQADVRHFLASVRWSAAAATQSVPFDTQLDRPLLAMPGSRIGLRLYSPMGAARAFALRTFHETIRL